MDINTIKIRLSTGNPDISEYISDISDQFVDKINNGVIKIIDVVQDLDPVLTNGSHEIRLTGVETLTRVIVSLNTESFSEKEIGVLSEFLCLRLIDYKSMELPTLKCLSYFIHCKNKPKNYNRDILNYLKQKANIKRMDSQNRKLIYELIRMIVMERHNSSGIMDSELVYNLVELFDGESDPENLMICFGTVTFILKNFKELEPYIDDIFEWISSYYPIDYTPNENDQINIQKSELLDALYECFYATELNSENLQSLLLEKLESNLISTKLESLKCLNKCYKLFSTTTIKNYASSLWTAVRMECLKKIDLLNPLLSDACYTTMSSLAKKLSSDEEFYFRFISDMYEELSIAFRKPELDLYEPAARLMAHAIQPQLKGFNYVLGKMLPIALIALKANEFKPVSGLGYIFEQLSEHHQGTKLSPHITEIINEIVEQVLSTLDTDKETLRFINSLVNYRIDLNKDTLDKIIKRLLDEMQKSSLDLESCLANICLSYNRIDILLGVKQNCDINTLTKLVLSFKNEENLVVKFSTYLRVVCILLHSSNKLELNSYDKEGLDIFLTTLRKEAITKYNENGGIISHIARIHLILINKLSEDHIKLLLMSLFTSEYCQDLIPKEGNLHEISKNCNTYLPILEAVLKSLVVRNNQFSVPLINLFLNFITSEKVDETFALKGSMSFDYIYKEDSILKLTRDNDYIVFALYKQKFYNQIVKEIKLRYNSQKEQSRKYILLSAIALQIPHLPTSIYKNDFEWLLRELIQLLLRFKASLVEDDKCSLEEHLISLIYECLDCLVKHDASGNLVGLLNSLVNLNLDLAKEAKTLEVRRQALNCLASMATSYKQTELLLLRSSVIDGLRDSLKDKKRLVRRAAADARLKWILIGQPIG